MYIYIYWYVNVYNYKVQAKVIYYFWMNISERELLTWLFSVYHTFELN